jgi:3-deoxy-manno-octulosonate cytidylyltransferase (CMP-KDO synthetase)
MKCLGVIPARYDSQRLPGKPLADIGGMSLIARVYKQAIKSVFLDDLMVATDDDRIALECKNIGAKYIMTSKLHPSGTDRIGEVRLIHSDFDVYVNIQGDMPFIPPDYIDLLCQSFDDTDVSIATLITHCDDLSIVNSSASIKVVTDLSANALYFSRSPIPYPRSVNYGYKRHIGIYAYRGSALDIITRLSPSPLERTESLEQLRWLENGLRIRTISVPHDTPSVDTSEDLDLARKYAEHFKGL